MFVAEVERRDEAVVCVYVFVGVDKVGPRHHDLTILLCDTLI